MRLRVLVSPAGTPRPVSAHPFDVLENGVAGARWTVADQHETDVPLNEGRAEFLRALQARAGTPARPPQQALVRLPRRLSGPRLHGGPLSIGAWQHVQIRCEERGNAGGWAEAIRWLRGILPTPPERPSSERIARAADLVYVELVPACWELSYPGAGLGLPKPLPRRRSRACPACAEMDGWGCQEHQPSISEAAAREVGRAVAAAGGKASDVRVEGDRIHFTATVERPLDEASELPSRTEPPAPTKPPVTRSAPDFLLDIAPRYFSVPVHQIQIGASDHTLIATENPRRAVQLARRGYRFVMERHDGYIVPLPPAGYLPSIRYQMVDIDTLTVVLLPGLVELPALRLSCPAVVDEHNLTATFPERDADVGAVLSALRRWEALDLRSQSLTLRIEFPGERRQLRCWSFGLVARGDGPVIVAFSRCANSPDVTAR